MPPDVQHRFHDPRTGVTYVVYAFRELEEHEIIDAIQIGLAHCKKKDWPQRGQTFPIFTVIGAEQS